MNIQGKLRAASWAPRHKEAEVSRKPRPEALPFGLAFYAQDSFEKSLAKITLADLVSEIRHNEH